MKPFLRKASFPVLYFLFLPGALLHTSTDHVQNSSYTLPLTLLKSSFSTLQNIILSTFLLMQLQRQSVRVMKESHLLAGIIINPNRLTFYGYLLCYSLSYTVVFFLYFFSSASNSLIRLCAISARFFSRSVFFISARRPALSPSSRPADM